MSDTESPLMVVYISGPMTLGNQWANVHHGVTALHSLMNLGFAPICPHLSVLAEIVRPRPHGDWLAVDLRLVEVCEVVLRLPGASVGADMEVAHAERFGIPVVHSVQELLAHRTRVESSKEGALDDPRPCHTA